MVLTRTTWSIRRRRKWQRFSSAPPRKSFNRWRANPSQVICGSWITARLIGFDTYEWRGANV